LRARTERDARAPAANPWAASDVREILIERGWLATFPVSALAESWMARAAAWLGPFAADRSALSELLGLVFLYDARSIAGSADAHVVLLRQGSRDVIRALGLEVLAGPAVDSERFGEIVAAVRRRCGVSGRPLFHSIRLALAGRAGEGELDRVILLLDAAAATPDFAPVKTARERMLEFCAAND
jgi:hypothetical protein